MSVIKAPVPQSLDFFFLPIFFGQLLKYSCPEYCRR